MTEPAPPPPVPTLDRLATALALLDAAEELYRSGHPMQLLSIDGRVIRLRAMAQTAARVIPIAKV